MDWSRVLDYCDVFISCLVSHSDGTHSLQSIHWEDDANVTLNLSRYVPMKKQPHRRWPKSEYIFRKFSIWGELFL